MRRRPTEYELYPERSLPDDADDIRRYLSPTERLWDFGRTTMTMPQWNQRLERTRRHGGRVLHVISVGPRLDGLVDWTDTGFRR